MRQILSKTDDFSVKSCNKHKASKEVAYLRHTPCTPPLRDAVSLAVTWGRNPGQCDEFRQTKQVGVLEWSQSGCVAIPMRRSDIWDRPAGHAAGGWGGLPDTSQQDVQG